MLRYGKTFTLVFIKNGSEILLGLKKRGFGVGKWNGFGGKVEISETIHEGALRETQEECNLDLNNLNYVGIVAYEVKSQSKLDIVHIFTSDKYRNNIKETDEMKPQWFNIQEIPFQKMWPDAKVWYPLMLKEKYFFAHVIYETEYKTCELEEFQSLDYVTNYMEKLIKNKIRN